jgi:signal transduction histidine kinase
LSGEQPFTETPKSDDRSDARRRLRLGGAQERATAAQILGNRGEPEDLEALRQAKQRELDHYVLGAINRALESIGRPPYPQGPQHDPHWEDESYQGAVREVTQMLVHELQDIVGFARLEIAAEVPNVESSRAAASVQRIADLLDAIELLGAIGSEFDFEQFDLTECLATAADREADRLNVEISLAGPPSVRVSGSASLVDLVLTKSIENAADSIRGSDSTKGSIVVDWGRTDRDAWFTVIDDGTGIAPGIDVFGFGRTTKEGHLGVGLTLARRGITALGGTLSLQDNHGRGASLRAAWPQQQQ